VLGPLFGNTTKNKTRSELIVMMRPVVAIAPAETAALREKTFESFAIPPDFDRALDPVGILDRAVRPKVLKELPVPRYAPPILRVETTTTTKTKKAPAPAPAKRR
jgi:type II secretory pathway component GspD/PulD (secretin)